MKTSRTIAMLFTLSLAAAACGDDRPTGPSEPAELKRNETAAQRTALLTDVPVAGPLSDAGVAAGSFVGSFTAKRFDIDPDTRQLSLTGVLSGTATLLDGTEVPVVDQAFTTTVELSRASTEGAAAMLRPVSAATCETADATASFIPVSFRTVQLASCNVLYLNLGPLHLDLLGLTVDLNQVILDVNAVPGPGNLLGNLLCALLGLLDVTALLTAITQLLTLINNILAGLNPGAAIGASFDAPAETVFSAHRSA